jgi:hypothetical protein
MRDQARALIAPAVAAKIIIAFHHPTRRPDTRLQVDACKKRNSSRRLT